jgi:RecA/RadA recombinase
MDMAFVEYQQSFISEFLSPSSVPWQVLSAPPGMGKTTVALEIVERVQKAEPNSQILFLGDATLATQAAEILQGRLASSESFYFSRQRLRELAPAAFDLEWPTRIVTMGDNVAKQADVFEKLKSSHWDLVVIDEAHRITDFIEALLPSLTHTRVLLLSGVELPPADPMLATFKTTHWRADRISNLGSTERTIYFQRSDAEHNVRERLAALRVELNETGRARTFWQILQQAASSSFNALEQLLTQQLSFVSDSIGIDSRASGMPEDVVTRDVDVVVDLWEDPARAAEALLSVLDAIARASRDEKLSAMLRVVEGISRRDRYGIWIVTSFRATAWYIGSSLSERGLRAAVLTADMPYSRIVEASTVSSQQQSIMVGTMASTKGLQFPGITDIILYDEPRSKTVVNLIRARVPEGLPVELSVMREGQ